MFLQLEHYVSPLLLFFLGGIVTHIRGASKKKKNNKNKEEEEEVLIEWVLAETHREAFAVSAFPQYGELTPSSPRLWQPRRTVF